MPNPVTVRFDQREFNETLRRYTMLSRRSPAEICNRKAYMINRRAVWHTKKADAEKIKKELGAAEAFTLHINKSGKNKGKLSQSKKYSTFAFDASGRFERIIIARLRKQGKAIPSADQLADYLAKAFKARLRSIAFLKSGFIPAREQFKNWCRSHGVSIGKAGLPPQESSGVGGPKVIGATKGRGDPANFNVWFARATFFNSADPKHSTQPGLMKFGEPALAKAFAEETEDTALEIEKRLKQHAHAVGIKTD